MGVGVGGRGTGGRRRCRHLIWCLLVLVLCVVVWVVPGAPAALERTTPAPPRRAHLLVGHGPEAGAVGAVWAPVVRDIALGRAPCPGEHHEGPPRRQHKLCQLLDFSLAGRGHRGRGAVAAGYAGANNVGRRRRVPAACDQAPVGRNPVLAEASRRTGGRGGAWPAQRGAALRSLQRRGLLPAVEIHKDVRALDGAAGVQQTTVVASPSQGPPGQR